MGKTARVTAAVTLSTVLCCSLAGAQTGGRAPGDTAAIPHLDTVVVTPDRSATSIRASTVAVNALPGSLIRALPFRSVGDALAIVPGIAVVDASSLGGNPRIIARGFYGGGETDYVSAQIDGVPVAALGSGAVDWSMLPLEGLSRLELVRGATSYLHGDAAVGGTLNALNPVSGPDLTWRAAGGSYRLADAALRATHGFGLGEAAIAADYRSSRGYRLGENSVASNLHARIDRYGGESSLSGFLQLHGRQFDDPGPLLATAGDRRARNGFFRFDQLTNRVDRAGLTGARIYGPAKLSGYLVGEYAAERAVKTLPLSTDFADTKLRRTKAPRALTSVQIELGDDVPGELGRLVAGVDATAGKLTSRYADIVAGDQNAYAASDGSASPADPPSRASRTSVAGFMHWQLRPVAPVRLSIGARVDHIADKFVPSSASGGNTERETHNAVSPRVAVNFALPSSQRTVTNAFLAAGRAFKSPTLDQLFDDRRIPIPVPPYSATVSNPNLVPQHGTSIEAGLYQSWNL
ncbi:MAG: TonB-dependent receptor, partial [Gemmatimonadales bacterium]